jgi:hypothetical protein
MKEKAPAKKFLRVLTKSNRGMVSCLARKLSARRPQGCVDESNQREFVISC